MIKEALSKDEEEHDASFAFKAMLPLAVATSIDALAVGISFAFLGVDIVPAALLIGITTFVLSAVGVYVGNAFGAKVKGRACRRRCPHTHRIKNTAGASGDDLNV